MLSVERQAYWGAYAEGTLSAQATRMLDHSVDIKTGHVESHRAPTSTNVQDSLLHFFGARTTSRLALRYDLLRGLAWAACSGFFS